MSKSSASIKNPLTTPRTAAEFLARWPGSTCKEFAYETGLSVYVLRLEDGTLVGTGANEGDLWDKGMSLMEKACPIRQRQVTVPGMWNRAGAGQLAA